MASYATSNHHSKARLKRLFPLRTVDNIVALFEHELDDDNCPNLAILSLVIGYIENCLTSNNNNHNIASSNASSKKNGSLIACHQSSTASKRQRQTNATNSTTTTAAAAAASNRSIDASNQNVTTTYGCHSISGSNADNNRSKELNGKRSLSANSNGSLNEHSLTDGDTDYMPTVHWNAIDAFYLKFKSQIKGSVDLSRYPRKTTRELVKRVSDVIWSNLTRSYYKDKAHLQTLYSYLTGNKLDCFGVAYAVVAACQVLGLNDVKLALSEDHAWVVFGEEGSEESAEVTWHGKGNEDKRGQSISTANCWLYLNGYPVVCSYQMTVAALVSAINPSINASTESEQLVILQQRLLWLLYDRGYLKLYPMAVGNLGDLEEMCPTPGARRTAVELFNEAIHIAKTHYNNRHVYPYTYLAGYLFRNGRFKEALKTWADAASVIKNYNYTRDDEEIYKEFLEIANELIPHVVKVVSAGGCEPSRMSTVPLLQDPDCFASLLRFYDGLCGWEEESSTPVLHVGWSKPFVATISKFTAFTRSKVKIKIPESENEEEKANEKLNEKANENDEEKVKTNEKNDTKSKNGIKSSDLNGKSPPPPLKTPDEIFKSIQEEIDEIDRNAAIAEAIDAEVNGNGDSYSKIAELAAACGEKILNPDYLLGNSTEPTLEPSQNAAISANDKSRNEKVKSEERAEAEEHSEESNESNDDEDDDSKAIVYLYSQKMVGLRDLLLAEKLNTSAIQLQLTAQSQVHLTKRARVGSFGSHSHAELDFVATTTTNLSSGTATCGQRTSKRIRRE